jgi:hypothetical protein
MNKTSYDIGFDQFAESAQHMLTSLQYQRIPREDVEITIKFKTFRQRDEFIWNLGKGLSKLDYGQGELPNLNEWRVVYAGLHYKFEVEEKRHANPLNW